MSRRPSATSNTHPNSVMKHPQTRARRALAALVGLFVIGTVNAATIYISSTIEVPAGQTYDGHGNTIVAQGMGDGGQSEGQKPFFKLNSGSTVQRRGKSEARARLMAFSAFVSAIS